MSRMEVTAYFDGGSRGNPGPSATGFVIQWSDKMDSLHGEYIGLATNNEAEWKSFITLLRYLRYTGAKKLKLFSDSKLVVNQFNGEWAASDRMGAFLKTAKEVSESFDLILLTWIPREQNVEADKLVNEALDAEDARV